MVKKLFAEGNNINHLYKSFCMPIASNTENRRAKKQLRLTLLFFVMFAIFLTGFTPVLFGILWNSWQLSFLFQMKFLFFNVTSALNPMLTLFMSKEFRSRLRFWESHKSSHSFSCASDRQHKRGQSNISSSFKSSTSRNSKWYLYCSALQKEFTDTNLIEQIESCIISSSHYPE